MNKIIAPLLLSLLASPALAASSPWFKTDGAQIRLISLPSSDGKMINAGLQIELEKGWKTYWRSPGASGLPPQLSFDGSQNVAKTKMHYPVPTTFGDTANLTAGYESSITFPIDVEPLFAGRSVALSLTGLVGICGEVCIPVQFQLALNEDGKGQSTRDVASALLFAKANLIKPAKKGFKVETAHYVAKKLTVSASVPENTSNSTLLIEGPSDWYLTPVVAKSLEGTTALFEVDLKDIPESADPTSTLLKFTLLSDNVGVEHELTPVRP